MSYPVAHGNTLEPLRFLLVLTADHITGATGKTPTVTIAKNNSAVFVVPAGAVSELQDGWYQVAANPFDADTLGVITLHATAAACDPTEAEYTVVNYNPTSFTPVSLPAPSSTGAQTFGDVWRIVRLTCPDAGSQMVQHWVQRAYSKFCSSRGWSWLRKETILTTQASRLVTVSATLGSTSVVSAGAFVPTDAGRQFRTTSVPVYTIAAVVDANIAILDLPFAGPTSGAVGATILDAYLICPDDFGRFGTIVNLSIMRQIPFWVTEEQLNWYDPQRQQTSTVVRVLASKKLGNVAANLNRVLYEWWPYPTAAIACPALYYTKPPVLTEDTPLQGVLNGQGDVLEVGALAMAAKWPGTREQPNPLFNLDLSKSYDQDFMDGINQLALRDDDQFLQDWSTLPWRDYSGFELSLDMSLLRASDALGGDGYGMSSY